MEKKRRLVTVKLIAILLYCYIAILPLGQLVRIPVQLIKLPEVNFYLTDIIIFLLVSVWLGRQLIDKDKFSLPPLGWPILFFWMAALLSLLVNYRSLLSGELGVASLYSLRWIVYAGIYFVVWDLVQQTTDLPRRQAGNRQQRVISLLMIAGFVTALLGLIQYFIVPDTRFLEKWGWDPHYYRAIGTFFDPGFLGIILVLTLILLTIKIWPLKNLHSKGGIVAWVLVYLVLALTYSRASYLAYLGGMGVIAWVKRSPKFFLTILVVGLITIFLLPRPGGEGVRLERESTIRFRMTNWRQSLIIIKDHPLFGVGFNAYRYAQKRYGFLNEQKYQVSHAGGGADSSLLFVLATTGILGLVSYLWLWKKIITHNSLNLMVLSSVAALLIHSAFLNSLFYPWAMGWFWILLGTGQLKEKNSL